ncbi:MAG: arginine--tRNA ligase [Clostridiales bacterium]|jgi:arginyl-tRNA synthetase|nr:arginine--tRNA ligase [Clostridiales bacterium]
MKKIVELISEDLKQAFALKGYDEKYGAVTVSNRPDLCQYQCNGAMAAAKVYKKAPIMIAQEVVSALQENSKIKNIVAIMPGFININLSDEFLATYINSMREEKDFGCEKEAAPKKVIIDYGGPNIAKPLHVGHMRSAIIGESLKRILKFMGNDAIGDVHLGDWGTPMGLVIAELKRRKPDMIYFDESFSGEYPTEAPFTISELEDIYPTASAYSKENPAFLEEAKRITYLMQNGHRGYMALWKHMQEVSVTDLKKIYDNLNVSFELWKMESDAQPYVTDMVEYLKSNNYARISDGALVVDVKEETDTKEIPPFMILKSDGATLYSTTDLATIVERVKLFDPDHMIYITDKRQELHFERLFRCAKKTKLVKEDTNLQFIGFGTMNGKDGKPFKTRDGGVLRLEHLIKMVTDEVYRKVMENRSMDEEEARQVASKVGLAALKYGDLSNQAAKDYVFDLERFTSFEGNTGPYILYTIVRIKSILDKFYDTGKAISNDSDILPAASGVERELMLQITRFSDMIHLAYEEQAPHRICQYIYDLADKFSSFYHDTKIISEENSEERQASLILMITLVQDILLTCIDLLAFEAPDRM